MGSPGAVIPRLVTPLVTALTSHIDAADKNINGLLNGHIATKYRL